MYIGLYVYVGRWDEDHLKATVLDNTDGKGSISTLQIWSARRVPLPSLQSNLFAEKQLFLFSSIILQVYFTLFNHPLPLLI